MKLIVGLGNPGEKYEKTRHNVGFMVIDALASTKVDSGKWMMDRKHHTLYTKHNSLLLAKPQTFMNNSGDSVSSLASYFKIHNSDLYVVHDDLDIRLGEYKIQFGVGPKVHNGVNSIEEKLGTKDFWRVRVGMDNREAAGPEGPLARRGEEYVLQNFNDDEKEILNQILKSVVADLIKILKIK
jgi:peptidyl-tRNA hydrolase, PTH1 family